MSQESGTSPRALEDTELEGMTSSHPKDNPQGILCAEGERDRTVADSKRLMAPIVSPDRIGWLYHCNQ